MGYDFNYTFPQLYVQPPAFSGLYSANSSSLSNETEDEKKERLKNEAKEKADAELQKRMDEAYQAQLDGQKPDTETPLTKGESKQVKKACLKIEQDKLKNEEASLGAGLLFTTPFLYPAVKSALKPKKNTLNMFYKSGAAHMDLFTKNPDLMMNAQSTMQKLEGKFLKDFNAAKGNSALQRAIVEERNFFRTGMQEALATNDPQKIAEATDKCKTASGVKNGFLRRTFRGWKKNPKVLSRFDAVSTAEAAGKFNSVKPPKESKSFFKNMFKSKITMGMTAVMAVIPVLLDWGNIQKAKEIDKQNEQKGKNTNYTKEQIIQTGIKSTASAITYTAVDTGVRTLAKKYLGKFAAKFAAKLAVKGGCKILGTAIGSCFPGIGTAIGLVAGTAADILLDKFVFSKMDYFKNTAVTRGELASNTAEENLSKLAEEYSNGKNIKNKEVLALLKNKCGVEGFNELKKMHNMSDKERYKYMLKKQQEAENLLNKSEQNQSA